MEFLRKRHAENYEKADHWKVQQFRAFRKTFIGNIFFNFYTTEDVLQTAIIQAFFICNLRRMALCKLNEKATNAGFLKIKSTAKASA
jgi:hypothetical protein